MTEQARNFYGRIKGKALKPAQKRYLDEDLPALELHGVNREENPDRQTVDAKGFFAQPRPLWLEIGFGGGEHLVYQAKRNPEIGIIGCEPYLNGVAMALGKIKAAGVSNLRLYTWDVRDLFDVLPDACLERAFLLYPDPWPKVRHHRRRFVTPDHLLPLARVMVPGGILRVATDIVDYVRQTMEEVPQAGFDCLSPDPEEWHIPWEDWVSTRYEQKALREGRRPHYLTFRRQG
ncbi:MAG: tRNA (guanine-N(7)-)-methyltransferase TrmB [Roseibaca calidilacus]|uniref:tRNA (guanine-N(7)-)-methyltransferase n=1 Tax=Roseibaca calidilacus TaxID=1666912 RepID=A0A0P7VYB7_9RHOB|nr:tRNA (guanine(46)-N(7))-methyltransferase TrmB [Roseibaca calidilacus]KPP92367.1 MAG: tRNA (guanine-N(7)-)-methyltransferase TrmB [Roseibaca calidilacus]CUX79662.1 tRNA (guanine-N(7)-)-methyltransferase [Roseibaca calidilacus]